MACPLLLYSGESQDSFKETIEMFKVQDETAELALCIGVIAALVWGIGLSLYGFQQPTGQLSWVSWSAQLCGGILACLLVPLVLVRGRGRTLARVEEPADRR
jgi:membrane associated rhomboid family serine protease